jgi:DNA-binding transcriptional MerR regulator
MFTIGDFARHGRVSVRMLRHYDAIGLLRPAKVDPASSYRFYEASQLARLNRIIALKDLGFTLEQVRAILDEQVSAGELRGMLRLRQAELQSQIAADAARLAQVEARLRIIEMEGAMPANDIQIKQIPAVRVAQLTATAARLEPGFITPVIRPLYEELGSRLGQAGLTPAGPAIAYYRDATDEEGVPDGEGVVVHATLPVSADPGSVDGLEFIDLPEISQAATIVHHGSMANIMATIQTLARWIDEHGYRSSGYPREVYLETSDDEDKWVTELQEPIAAA